MSPTPPVAKRVTHRTDRHGRIVEDDWAWLADRDDPDTLAYLEAENDLHRRLVRRAGRS